MRLPGWRAVIARPTPVVVNTATTASASPQNSWRSPAPATSTSTARTRAAIRAPSDQASVFERRTGSIFTSPRIGGNRAGTELRRLRSALGRGAQVADAPLVAGAEEPAWVGLAVLVGDLGLDALGQGG